MTANVLMRPQSLRPGACNLWKWQHALFFSFNDVIYQQTDGIAMRFSLGLALANIFVGYYESELFDSFPEPLMYYCCMNDTFVVFDNERKCDLFLEQLNLLQPSLQFTFKKSVTYLSPFTMLWLKKLR